jgi:hypothetical protein
MGNNKDGKVVQSLNLLPLLARCFAPVGKPSTNRYAQ